MNFVNVLNDFKKLGCNEKEKYAAACRVYLDLILGKRYCSVEKIYHRATNLIILFAERKGKKKFIIIPALISQELDLSVLYKLQIETSEENSLLLALCDTSSNVLYYRPIKD
ncbi:uncharacterized protein ACRADG_011545 isoform 2-T2 [Cochliomyia hominivorax]